MPFQENPENQHFLTYWLISSAKWSDFVRFCLATHKKIWQSQENMLNIFSRQVRHVFRLLMRHKALCPPAITVLNHSGPWEWGRPTTRPGWHVNPPWRWPCPWEWGRPTTSPLGHVNRPWRCPWEWGRLTTSCMLHVCCFLQNFKLNRSIRGQACHLGYWSYQQNGDCASRTWWTVQLMRWSPSRHQTEAFSLVSFKMKVFHYCKMWHSALKCRSRHAFVWKNSKI